jgi:hypothetical protein
MNWQRQRTVFGKKFVLFSSHSFKFQSPTIRRINIHIQLQFYLSFALVWTWYRPLMEERRFRSKSWVQYLYLISSKREEDQENYIMINFVICIFHLFWDKERRIKWVKRVVCLEDMRNIYVILIGKLQGNISLGILRRKCKDNNQMALKEIRY